MKTVNWSVAGFLMLVVLGHLVRLLGGITVVVGGFVVPMWPSAIVVLVLPYPAFRLWRER